MGDINSQQEIEAVKALVATLDVEDIARKSNALTGGTLRGEDAARVVEVTALSAIRTPGFEILAAGIRAEFFGGELRLAFVTPLAKARINHGKDFL